jgi:hypothetical protein
MFGLPRHRDLKNGHIARTRVRNDSRLEKEKKIRGQTGHAAICLPCSDYSAFEVGLLVDGDSGKRGAVSVVACGG